MEDKTCENCDYFFKHYCFNGHRFVYANCGHCVNYDVQASTRLHKKNFRACTMWAPLKKQAEEKQQKMLATLKNVAKSLDDILNVLQSDIFT